MALPKQNRKTSLHQSGDVEFFCFTYAHQWLTYLFRAQLRFNEALNVVWHVELELEPFGCDTEIRQMLMNEFMCLVRGMAFQSQWRNDPEYFQGMLDSWLPGHAADSFGSPW